MPKTYRLKIVSTSFSEPVDARTAKAARTAVLAEARRRKTKNIKVSVVSGSR